MPNSEPVMVEDYQQMRKLGGIPNDCLLRSPDWYPLIALSLWGSAEYLPRLSVSWLGWDILAEISWLISCGYNLPLTLTVCYLMTSEENVFVMTYCSSEVSFDTMPMCCWTTEMQVCVTLWCAGEISDYFKTCVWWCALKQNDCIRGFCLT